MTQTELCDDRMWRKRGDFKDEDNMKLCFIHITFILAYMLRNAAKDTVNDLDFLMIIKHEIVWCTVKWLLCLLCWVCLHREWKHKQKTAWEIKWNLRIFTLASKPLISLVITICGSIYDKVIATENRFCHEKKKSIIFIFSLSPIPATVPIKYNCQKKLRTRPVCASEARARKFFNYHFCGSISLNTSRACVLAEKMNERIFPADEMLCCFMCWWNQRNENIFEGYC